MWPFSCKSINDHVVVWVLHDVHVDQIVGALQLLEVTLEAVCAEITKLFTWSDLKSLEYRVNTVWYRSP